MTIYELTKDLEQLCLDHKQIKEFQIGHQFKSNNSYPAAWLETPITTDYVDPRRKTHTMALNVLVKPDDDGLDNELLRTSEAEEIADDILMALDQHYTKIGLSDLIGLSTRMFTSDKLVGVVIDISFTVGRPCDYKTRFNREFE